MKQHTDWLESRIEAVAALATKTFVTLVKYPAPNENTPVTVPYVVIHPADGADRTDRLTGPKVVQNPRFTLHSVGATATQAAWAAKVVKDQLVINGIGVTPIIDGERCGRVWYSAPIPLQTDTDGPSALVFHVAECGFESNPA